MTLEWTYLEIVLFAGLTALVVLAVIAVAALRNGRRATKRA